MRLRGFGLLFFWGVQSGLCAAWSACSEFGHSCAETRTCPEPIALIDAGPVDDWWDSSNGGESATDDASAGEGGAPSSTSSVTPGFAGEAGATDSVASSAPAILAVSPPNGAIGVASDASIVITFSTPMNEASLTAAYSSLDLPPSVVAFEWNAARTVLTLKPQIPLVYQSGGAAPNGVVGFTPKSYHFGLSSAALDDHGRALRPANFGFSTLRQVSAEIPADPALTGNYTDGEGEGIHNCVRGARLPYTPAVCIGDDANNVRYTGFISFDLSTLPQSLARITNAALLADATIYGSPDLLGASKLEHVTFAELDASALALPASADLGPFFASTAAPSGSALRLDLDVTSSVSADNIAPNALKRSQFRLSFANISVNSTWDDVELGANSIELSLTYLLP